MAGVPDVGTVAVAVVKAGSGGGGGGGGGGAVAAAVAAAAVVPRRRPLGRLEASQLSSLRVSRRVSVVVGIVDEADCCDILKRSLGCECGVAAHPPLLLIGWPANPAPLAHIITYV